LSKELAIVLASDDIVVRNYSYTKLKMRIDIQGDEEIWKRRCIPMGEERDIEEARWDLSMYLLGLGLSLLLIALSESRSCGV
jgi:hypothetical protein